MITVAGSAWEEGGAAGALAERLGALAECMLIAVDRNDGEALLGLLREQEEVRERLAPLIAHLRADFDRLRANGDPGAEVLAVELGCLAGILERVFRANQVLEEEAARACAALEAQLATHRQRSGAVLSYGVGDDTSGGGFTRVG